MRGWLGLTLVIALGAITLSSTAPAQPAPTGKPAPLPSWHPPLDPPTERVPPKPSSKDRQTLMQEQLNRLRDEAAKRGKGKAGGAVVVAPPGARKPKTPVDEHGFCPGHGADERPPDINLAHGWLAIDNEEAVPPPIVPRPRDDESWTDGISRLWPYWKWQITPYPYRYQNQDDPCDRRNQPVPLLANLVNFGALIFLFVRFGKKPIGEALRRRRDEIMVEIDEAKQLKLAAQKRRRGYEEDLGKLDQKLAQLRTQYALEGEVEEKRVREEAADARRRMLADADFRVSQESKSASEHLSREALDQALSAAQRLLTESVTQADHDRLAQEYLDQIGPALARRTVVGKSASSGGAS